MADLHIDRSRYILPNDTGLCFLECSGAFEGLTAKEKHYAHYLARASFEGALICLIQVLKLPDALALSNSIYSCMHTYMYMHTFLKLLQNIPCFLLTCT